MEKWIPIIKRTKKVILVQFLPCLIIYMKKARITKVKICTKIMKPEEAIQMSITVPNVYRKLKTLIEVGLEYIKVGQSATTISGGEAQRIKLTKELAKRGTGNTIYLLDEPTTWLHFHDVKKLLEVLHNLVDKGNTTLIIEHNLEVIKSADHIIDLGPEGGDWGGQIVAKGTPEEVVKHPNSYTAKFLKPLLNK